MESSQQHTWVSACEAPSRESAEPSCTQISDLQRLWEKKMSVNVSHKVCGNLLQKQYKTNTDYQDFFSNFWHVSRQIPVSSKTCLRVTIVTNLRISRLISTENCKLSFLYLGIMGPDFELICKNMCVCLFWVHMYVCTLIHTSVDM